MIKSINGILKKTVKKNCIHNREIKRVGIKTGLMFLLSAMLIATSCNTQVDILAPKGEKGDSGFSAYEIWKERVLSGSITWSKEKISIGHFFEFLMGKGGENGKNAYEIWKEAIQDGNVPNPHKKEEMWDPSKNKIEDFWEFLRGNNGKDGRDGDIHKIELGKPNVIPSFYNASLEEYVNPDDGSVIFNVFDKVGAKAPAGSRVQGLPGVDAEKEFIVDMQGQIKLMPNDLPNRKTLEERQGKVSQVTINGETLESAYNTLVPNRINTRIITKKAYLRQASTFYWTRQLVNHVTVINFIYEREVDGVWKEYPESLPDPEVYSVKVKDPFRRIDVDNINDDAESHQWGKTFLFGDFSSYKRNRYLIIRPIVLTEEEKNYLPESSNWHDRQIAQNQKFEWKGEALYFSLRGNKNFYGQKPVMPSAIKIPEIYPICGIKDARLQIVQGQSNLLGTIDIEALPQFYMNYEAPTSDGRWEINPLYKEELSDNTEFVVAMTKNIQDSSGNTNIKGKRFKNMNPNFIMDSAYKNNFLALYVYLYDPQGRVTNKDLQPDIESNYFAAYRDRAIYKLIQENDRYYLEDAYKPGSKTGVPLTNQRP